MRRVAASRLYIAGKDEPLTRYIAEVSDDGRLANYYALGSELPMTEWLGGILLASPCSECDITHPTNFDEVLKALKMNSTDCMSYYVWHISRIKVDTLEILDGCVFERLETDEDL